MANSVQVSGARGACSAALARNCGATSAAPAVTVPAATIAPQRRRLDERAAASVSVVVPSSFDMVPPGIEHVPDMNGC
jgi:hypothetical protein